jgi:hypothetical protein
MKRLVVGSAAICRVEVAPDGGGMGSATVAVTIKAIGIMLKMQNPVW